MSMQVHILMRTAVNENIIDILGVYQNIADARAKMTEDWQSSKDFWDRQDKSRFAEVNLQLSTDFAEAFVVYENREQFGVTWTIETSDVQ